MELHKIVELQYLHTKKVRDYKLARSSSWSLRLKLRQPSIFLKLLGIVSHSRAACYLHDLISYFVKFTLDNLKQHHHVNYGQNYVPSITRKYLQVRLHSQLLQTLYLTFLQVFDLLMCYIHYYQLVSHMQRFCPDKRSGVPPRSVFRVFLLSDCYKNAKTRHSN